MTSVELDKAVTMFSLWVKKQHFSPIFSFGLLLLSKTFFFNLSRDLVNKNVKVIIIFGI